MSPGLFLYLAISASALAADTNDVPELSSLRPPRGQILPSFWEQYGAWVILLSALLVMAVGLVIWIVSRPKPMPSVPWFVQARRELEPLLQQAEDGALLSCISQILRRGSAGAQHSTQGRLQLGKAHGVAQGQRSRRQHTLSRRDD